jgi:hypothetical protein
MSEHDPDRPAPELDEESEDGLEQFGPNVDDDDAEQFGAEKDDAEQFGPESEEDKED